MSQQARGFRTFVIIWLGQMVSVIGSGLTAFGLGVYIYEQTSSATLFALNILAYTLPQVVFSPISGALVDRFDRRLMMIVSDSGAGLSALALVALVFTGRIEVWHIFVCTFFYSAFSSIQWPAFSAATTLLVPKEQLGRASGMVQMNEGISQLIAPALGGVLFVAIGIQGLVLIDVATFAFAVLTMLLLVSLPQPERSAAGEQGRGSLLKEAVFGWAYIRQRPGLFGLLLYFAAINLVTGVVGPLFGPMILNMTTPDVYGYVGSVLGLGMLAGTLIMSAWGGPKRLVAGIMASGAITGLFIALAGARPSIPLIAVSGFFFLLSVPIATGCSQALWQRKVEPDVQGRVFSVRRMIAWSMEPLAILLAGPLADRVFEPLMATGGPLADSVGRVIGAGPGRGVGLMFIIAGLLSAAVSLAAYAMPRVRHVEDEIPDAIGEISVSAALGAVAAETVALEN
jgi:DHA3 family macrolide efflux protein-like MFS transporter